MSARFLMEMIIKLFASHHTIKVFCNKTRCNDRLRYLCIYCCLVEFTSIDVMMKTRLLDIVYMKPVVESSLNPNV